MNLMQRLEFQLDYYDNTVSYATNLGTYFFFFC